MPRKTAGFSSSAPPPGELSGLGPPRGVAIDEIDAPATQPLDQRQAEMTGTATGPPLVELQNDCAVWHVSHMPHRPIVERDDLHHRTTSERKRKKAGAAPEGTAPAQRKWQSSRWRYRPAEAAGLYTPSSLPTPTSVSDWLGPVALTDRLVQMSRRTTVTQAAIAGTHPAAINPQSKLRQTPEGDESRSAIARGFGQPAAEFRRSERRCRTA